MSEHLQRRLGPLFLLSLVLLTTPVEARAQVTNPASDAIESHMNRFFAAWTGRALTRPERRAVVAEMMTLHEGDAASATEAARSFAVVTERLKTESNAAALRSVRKQLLVTNHFHEGVGTTSRRLIYEPDPPRVSDASSLRLLTNRDLEALVRLRAFVVSGTPRPLRVKAKARDQLATRLEAIYGNGTELPRIYADASVVWLALTARWQRWTPAERQLAQRYVDRAFEIDMNPFMYQQLLGLDVIGATARQREDLRDQTRSMLGAIPDMATSNRVLDDAIRAATAR